MGTYIAGVRNRVSSGERGPSPTTVTDRRRFDVSELPASQATDYVDGWGRDGSAEVFFERRAGKTYAVAAGGIEER